MAEVGAHHQPEWHFLKPRREIPRCLDADSELTGFGPAFQADCFPADARPLINADFGLGQTVFTGFAVLPLRTGSVDFWFSGVDNRACHSLACSFLVANQLIRSDHHKFRGIIEMIRFFRVDGQVLGKLKLKT